MTFTEKIISQRDTTKEELDRALLEVEAAQKEVDSARSQLEFQNSEIGNYKKALTVLSPMEKALLASCSITSCTDDDVRASRNRLKVCESELQDHQANVNVLRERLSTFEDIIRKMDQIVNKDGDRKPIP